ISSTEHIGDGGLTLRINVSRVPVGLWRAVRVTPEGYWLAAEDLIDAPDYAHRAVARLRDYGFDSRRAYEAGGGHLRRTVRSGAVDFPRRVPGAWAENSFDLVPASST